MSESVKKAKRGRPPKTAVAVREKKASPPVRIENTGALMAVDPQALIAQAIDKNLPIESMERLLAMRRELKAEWAKEQYFTALAGFQHECPVIAKEKKVKSKKKADETEAATKYTYAPIEDIVATVKPVLEKWGFSYTFKSKQEAGLYTAICVAHHKDGHEEETTFTVPTSFPEYMNMSGAQMQGASCTYADRYAFKNAFGIVTKGEDTDAGGDEEKRTPIKTPQAKREDAPIPAQHENIPAPGSKSEFDALMASTEKAPGVGIVAIFTENEVIDWRALANDARENKVALAKVFADIRALVDSRRKAIKGETK
jgi:hypothetical protein